jgi:hypothetical protein
MAVDALIAGELAGNAPRWARAGPACWYPGEPYSATRSVTAGLRAAGCWPAEPGEAAGPGPEQPASAPAVTAMAASAAIREIRMGAPGREESLTRD